GPGQEVVETRGRAPTTSKTYRDAKRQPWPNLPVVVLANGGTASAAEIITGALQDHDRAVVVGTPTFGKGLVQSLWQLTPETALKLTTARWYTPSGRTIQRKSKNEEDQVAQVDAAELRRRMDEDRQVQAALALVRRAKSPQDLLSLAAAQAPATPRN